MSVLVYTENWEGQFKKKTYELITYARAIADQLNTTVTAISIGKVDDAALEKLGTYGATKVKHIDTDLETLDNRLYAKAIADAAEAEDSGVVVFSDNFTGKALAPRVSAKLKAGFAGGVFALPESFDPFVIKSKVFSGKAFANVKINSDKKILALQTNSFDIAENPTEVTIEKASLEGSSSIKLKDVEKVTDKIILTDAEVIVSGGRGMKGPDNWGGIEELATKLGAATGCSRPVSDDGWRPHEEHVGQTGKVVAPNVYIALGISGAIQHIAGISGSKYIVAVNKDDEAPIFNVADFGIVGDVNEVVPKMVEAVEKLKG